MEDIISWIMVYLPSVASIATCIFTFIKCVKSIKDNVGDTKKASEKLMESLTKVTTDFDSRLNQSEVELSYVRDAMAVKNAEIERLQKENEELKKAVAQFEDLSDNLNTIKNQLTVVIDKEK